MLAVLLLAATAPQEVQGEDRTVHRVWLAMVVPRACSACMGTRSAQGSVLAVLARHDMLVADTRAREGVLKMACMTGRGEERGRAGGASRRRATTVAMPLTHAARRELLGFFDTISNAVSSAADAVSSAVSTAVNTVSNGVTSFTSEASDAVTTIQKAVNTTATPLSSAATTAVTTLEASLQNVSASASNALGKGVRPGGASGDQLAASGSCHCWSGCGHRCFKSELSSCLPVWDRS